MLKIILRFVLEVNVTSLDVMEFVSEILFCKEGFIFNTLTI